jgi:hypothetical protein
MAFIRGQERLVYETTKTYLTTQLTALGWFSSTLPFAAVQPGPVTLLDYVPPDDQAKKPNTIAFTSGTDDIDAEQEIGAALGGLWETDHVFFVDIWGESQGIAKQLASDIRAILTGRLPGCSRCQPIMDLTQNPPVVAPGHYIQYEDVETTTPVNQDNEKSWRVVKVRAEHYYTAVEVGT